MTWRERAIALQLTAEERYGVPMRARAEAAWIRENEAAEQGKEALK
jgi:hypothetical protein